MGMASAVAGDVDHAPDGLAWRRGELFRTTLDGAVWCSPGPDASGERSIDIARKIIDRPGKGQHCGRTVDQTPWPRHGPGFRPLDHGDRDPAMLAPGRDRDKAR